ncbi:phosphoribosyl-AMP cyclohydrolase [Allopontixanthobacter sediminis]|uniref:Histidine biosynthesis bifunctional protein HisIE n=1 Tax=Allopontixanthobacter sediminis TaxID=1689985 RepID=A0A845B0J1_9SPHN|nr:phosphoribosyl-AMP cyclohydrolase [Allopontixanthobacter sediminis]
MTEVKIENADREAGKEFMPKFDSNGLLTAVVTNAETNTVLMVAMMDQLAIARTRETGIAHFHSRSRGRLWMKGETSGNTLTVKRILVDCDQDALILECEPAGPTCHTGASDCFYRELVDEGLKPKSD